MRQLAVFAVMTLLVAACGDASPPDSVGDTQPEEQPADDRVMRLTGEVEIEQGFYGEMRDSADDIESCDGYATSFQVQLKDGADSIVAIADFVESELSSETTESNGKWLRCNFVYEVDAPDDLSAYVFVLAARSDDEELDHQVLSRSDLDRDGAPRLSVIEAWGP